MELANSYVEIVKFDKNSDGTATVYGKATNDDLDIEQQICDATWLDSAMPAWFKSGGNIREQHSNIAAGVAKEYEKKDGDHFITALVVDPVSVKKVETGVLKGFSIGIKNPRVVRDTKAANGRIIDGQIVEVSLVDRPANPSCQLVLAKSVDGESTLTQVEDLVEKKTNYEKIIPDRKGSPADKDLYAEVVAAAKKKFDVYPSAVANAWVVREYKKRGGKYTAKEKTTINTMDKASELVEMAKAITPTTIKFDQAAYDTARQALAQLIIVETQEMAEGSDEQSSLANLLEAVHHLFAWYEGEMSEGEVNPESGEEMEMSTEADIQKDPDSKECMCKCAKCADGKGCDSKECKCAMAKDPDPDMDKEKSLNGDKCLECGCHKPADDHGSDSVTTAEMVEEKSAEAEETTEEKAEEPATEDSTPANDVDIEAIVEKAIQSATAFIKAEVASLLAAKEVAEEKAAGLETELAKAKSLAVAGGPRRTAKPVDIATSDLLTKANAYKAKANATTDPKLAEGYRILAEKFSAKASEATLNK